MSGSVLVVIGLGGMGEAIVRRVGTGRPVVVADFDEVRLHSITEALRRGGYELHPRVVDVSDRAALVQLAAFAGDLGPITSVVHTAGLAPSQAAAERIIEVDLVGTAYSLDAFGAVIAPGGAGVYIASVAAHILAGAVDEATSAELANLPAEDLAKIDLLQLPGIPEGMARGLVYGYCKRGNQLRVQYAAPTWGDRGARVNSISPGVTATTMGRAEYDAEFAHAAYETMVADSPAGRFGTAEDVAAATEFLLDGSRAGFITGTDLLVDGGVVAGIRSGRLKLA